MIEIKKLVSFVQVADSGSFTQAAILLNIAHSGLSRQILELERQLGYPLFYRTGRGVRLTEFGEHICESSRNLIACARQFEDEATALKGAPRGLVKIGLPGSVAMILAGPLFERIRDKYPQIRVRLIEGLSGLIEEMLSNARLDLGMFFATHPTPSLGQSLLGYSDLYLISAHADRLTRKPTVRLAQLAGIPLILPGRPHAIRAFVEEAAAKISAKLTIPYEVDSLLSMKAAAESGVGYTVTMFHSVAPEVQAGRLQASKITAPVLTRALILASTTHQPLTIPARAVLQEVSALTKEFIAAGKWNARLTK